MYCYPPAKINIGLSIVEKRTDGFHNIETVFFPISLCDSLTVEPAKKCAVSKLDFQCTGIELPDGGNFAENLCCKAYRLIDADYDLPPAKIRLHKNIPAGAGLGGGSSDAAYALLALNKVFRLSLTPNELKKYAIRLGSDCAFFMPDDQTSDFRFPKPAFGVGKGDRITTVKLSLDDYHIIVVKPPVFVSTADAYSSATPKKTTSHLPDLLQAPVSEWHRTIFNDFESTVFKKFPEIGKIKEKLYAELFRL